MGIRRDGITTALSTAFGPINSQDTLPLHLVSETATTITLGWTPPTGILGYIFYVNGKRVSNTWDATRKTTSFSRKPSAVYQVVAIKQAASGRYQT